MGDAGTVAPIVIISLDVTLKVNVLMDSYLKSSNLMQRKVISLCSRPCWPVCLTAHFDSTTAPAVCCCNPAEPRRNSQADWQSAAAPSASVQPRIAPAHWQRVLAPGSRRSHAPAPHLDL